MSLQVIFEVVTELAEVLEKIVSRSILSENGYSVPNGSRYNATFRAPLELTLVELGYHVTSSIFNKR